MIKNSWAVRQGSQLKCIRTPIDIFLSSTDQHHWTGNNEVGDTLTFDRYMELGHVATRYGDERSVTFEAWFLLRYGRQRRVESSVDNFSTMLLLVLGVWLRRTIQASAAELGGSAQRD